MSGSSRRSNSRDLIPLARSVPTRSRKPIPRQRGPDRQWRIYLAVIGALLLLLVAKINAPHQRASEQHAQVLLLEKQVARLDAEQERLRREKMTLMTKRGQQEEARRQGYVLPGERRIVFVQPQPAPPLALPASAEE